MIVRPWFVRWAGLSAGLAVHALFAVTVYQLVFFLRGTPPVATSAPLRLNVLLALQFAVVHSTLLLPGVRSRLGRVIGPAFYGLFYCAATCSSLLLVMANWQVGSWAVWQLHGWPRAAMYTAFSATWVALLYSLSLTGLGYQTGFTPWWSWLRRQPVPKREFKPRGAYNVLRHPVYLSFLGLLWFTPEMTVDRAVLTGIWTVYVFIGSYLKDRRLAHYIGQPYRSYQARVPGFPGMVIGPLARTASAIEV